MDSVCLESEWQIMLKQLMWTDSCVEIYKQFIAQSTRNLYNRYLSLFYDFCLINYGRFPPHQNYLSAAIAEFLKVRSEHSERPESMLRGIMAALSNYFSIPGRYNPISNELKNLVKALIKTGTVRQAGRTSIMPIAPFSRLFENWGDNEALPLTLLRQKAITLLAIACLARPSDFSPSAGFNRDQIKFNSDGSATIFFFGVKNDANRSGFEVRIEPTDNILTDPVECLKVYFKKSAPFINDLVKQPVFITLKPPYNGISAQTVSHILNTSIKDAGLSSSEFSAKSFRPSAATAAIVSGCDPNTTRVRGRWKNDNVFFSNYVYPTSETNISDKILTSNIEL